MRTIDLDVDPERVAGMLARRASYRVVTAHWGRPKRCLENVVDGDGSCVFCGDDQGERARCRE